MAVGESIRPGMQVIGSDGGMVGRVTGVHGNHIHLEPDAPAPDAPDHTLPLDWVARVDDHVHLNVIAELARDRWGNGGDGFAPASAGVRKDAYTGMGKSWIVWLFGAILLVLVIVLGVRACGYAVSDPNYDGNTQGAAGDGNATLSGAAETNELAAALPINGEVEVYFASASPAPHTFTFQNLQFDTGSAAIGSDYRAELADLGHTLAAQPDAKLRIVGYADARGNEAPNQALGKQRADAVAAALIANGVNPDNIETVSGGENAPAADNATAQGQAENRPTDLVIVSR